MYEGSRAVIREQGGVQVHHLDVWPLRKQIDPDRFQPVPLETVKLVAGTAAYAQHRGRSIIRNPPGELAHKHMRTDTRVVLTLRRSAPKLPLQVGPILLRAPLLQATQHEPIAGVYGRLAPSPQTTSHSPTPKPHPTTLPPGPSSPALPNRALTRRKAARGAPRSLCQRRWSPVRSV